MWVHKQITQTNMKNTHDHAWHVQNYARTTFEMFHVPLIKLFWWKRPQHDDCTTTSHRNFH